MLMDSNMRCKATLCKMVILVGECYDSDVAYYSNVWSV